MIYFIQETGLLRNRIKIGYTDNIRQRLNTLQGHSPSKIKLVLALPGGQQDEYIYHARFARYRLHREWFKAGLRLRFFILVNSLLYKQADFSVKATANTSAKPSPQYPMVSPRLPFGERDDEGPVITIRGLDTDQ